MTTIRRSTCVKCDEAFEYEASSSRGRRRQRCPRCRDLDAAPRRVDRSRPICAECAKPYRPGVCAYRAYCSNRCVWRAKARRRGVDCSACGQRIMAGKGVLRDGTAKCHPCRAAARAERPPEAVRREPRWLFCPTCDRFFDTKHPTKKYCSPSCRQGRGRDRPWKHNVRNGRRVRASSAWLRVRAKVVEQESHCWLCGELVDKARRFPDRWSASVDHVIPIAKGGAELDRDNLRLAHLFCNLSRGQKTAHLTMPAA